NNSQHSGRFVSKYLDAPNQPLFAFGYGLSYHQTSYSNLVTNQETFSQTEPLTVSVTVTNDSEIAGQEVVQLYIRDLFASIVRPVKELKAFQKISLEGKASQTVTFEITEEMVRFYGKDLQEHSEKGEFEIFIGKNSEVTESVIVKLV
ncbi:fibronectin type III-like domain-contianing protein, partial [Vagococcus salmoninarum]